MKRNIYKIFFFIGLLVTAPACELKPIYKRNSSYTTQSTTLSVQGDSTQGFYTYLFKKELETHLSAFPQFQANKIRISVNLIHETGDIGFGVSSVLRTQERFQADVNVFLTPSSFEPYKKFSADVVSSVTIDDGEEFANISSQAAAKERIIKQLAQDVAQQIASILKN